MSYVPADDTRDPRLDELATFIAVDFPRAGLLLVSRAFWEFRRAESVRPGVDVSELWYSEVRPAVITTEYAIAEVLSEILLVAPELRGQGEEWLREYLDGAVEVALSNLVLPTVSVVRRIWAANGSQWLAAARSRHAVWRLETSFDAVQDDADAGARTAALVEQATSRDADVPVLSPRAHAFAVPRRLIVPLVNYALASGTDVYEADNLRAVYAARLQCDGLPVEAFAQLGTFWRIILVRSPEQQYWNAVLRATAGRDVARQHRGNASGRSSASIGSASDATKLVESYLQEHGVSRQLLCEDVLHGYLVFQVASSFDLPGHLPVYYVERTGGMYKFPGDSSPELMYNANPSNPDADPSNSLNRSWKIR